MREDRYFSPEKLWWEEIAGPASLISDIQESFSCGKSVICNVSKALSFRWFFRDEVDHWVAMQYGVSVEYVDCDGEYKGEDITEFLLKKIMPHQHTEYCRHPNPQYMRDKKLLHKKLLWIRGVEEQYLQDWIRYVAAYRSASIDTGLMLLEVYKKPAIRIPENLRYVRYEDYVQEDDLRLYTSIMAESVLQCSSELKRYAVELVSSLCVYDAEMANSLLSRERLLEDEPLEVLRDVVETYYRNSPRGRAKWNPISLLQENDMDTLDHKIWSAQIRVCYPIIEQERRKIISQWYDQIKNALENITTESGEPIRYEDFDGNRILDPRDVEIGMLNRIAYRKGLYDDDPKRRCIWDSDLREKITFLKNCRNCLAHMDACKPQVIRRLLTGEAVAVAP